MIATSSAYTGWPLCAAVAVCGYALWWLTRYSRGGR